MERETERRLVKAARTDASAFGALYDAYVGRILSYTYRLLGSPTDAEEATAETFFKALRAIGRFRWRRCGVLPWLYRIAAHEAANLQRRRARGVESPLPPQLPGPVRDELEEAEARAAGRELARALSRALASLREADRQIVTLHYLQGEPYPLIAQVLRMREGAVRVRAMRALRKLEVLLEKEGWDRGRVQDAEWATAVCGGPPVRGVPEGAAPP